MISESKYYKEFINSELTRIKDIQNEHLGKNPNELPEMLSFEFEKFIFLSSYFIRKLYENDKTSEKFKKIGIRVSKIDLKPGIQINLLNRWVEGDNYEFENSKEQTIEFHFLSNYLIHSYVFDLTFTINDDVFEGIDGFFVSSDRIKDKHLYHVKMNDYFELINSFAEDVVTYLRV